MKGEVTQTDSHGGDANFKEAVIVFKNGPSAATSPVSVTLKHKQDPVNHQRISCWYVVDTASLIGDQAYYRLL